MYRKIVWNKKGVQSVKQVPSNKSDGIEKKKDSDGGKTF